MDFDDIKMYTPYKVPRWHEWSIFYKKEDEVLYYFRVFEESPGFIYQNISKSKWREKNNNNYRFYYIHLEETNDQRKIIKCIL